MMTAVDVTTAKLQKNIADLEYLLNEMANVNFNIQSSCELPYKKCRLPLIRLHQVLKRISMKSTLLRRVSCKIYFE